MFIINVNIHQTIIESKCSIISVNNNCLMPVLAFKKTVSVEIHI
uniref:Uncharacterized protein n=1 Tax=Anguilla anguilla TaxID=7936 RepID=A0A0E9XJC1_ANGAN